MKSDLEFIHDCRERRHTSMQGALDALAGCRDDLLAFANTPIGVGVSYDVARRLDMLMGELAEFRARDLLNQRRAS